MQYCYINNTIVPLSDASVPATDLSIQRAYAIFDFLKIVNNRLYKVDDHLERIKKSADLSYLKIPLSFDDIKTISNQLVEKSNLKNPAIKLILTASSDDSEKDNLIIIAEELPNYDLKLYTHGLRLITENYQRELPAVKSTNYMNFFRLKRKFQLQSDEDILYYNEKSITECPRSNFFAIKDGILITPKEHILEGITRKTVLKLIEANHKLEIRDIPLNEIDTLDEAFITSTTRGIMPIAEIDKKKLSDGKIGPITSVLRKFLQKELETYS